MTIETKNPVKVRAGRIGATKRWGTEPRVVRLHDLSDAQRRLVRALVDAARREAGRMSEEPEARRVRDELPAA